METQLEKLISLKDSDKKIQIIVGIMTILLAPFTFCISFYLLGITHAGSTIYWAFRKNTPRTTGRKIIEPINLAVMLIYICGISIANTWLCDTEIIFYLTAMLLCIGPVLGISYFLITVNELRNYRSLKEQGDETLFTTL